MNNQMVGSKRTHLSDKQSEAIVVCMFFLLNLKFLLTYPSSLPTPTSPLPVVTAVAAGAAVTTMTAVVTIVTVAETYAAIAAAAANAAAAGTLTKT